MRRRSLKKIDRPCVSEILERWLSNSPAAAIVGVVVFPPSVCRKADVGAMTSPCREGFRQS